MRDFPKNYFPVPNALAAYLSLLHHADRRGGECFPSYRTIGAEAGLSRNSVSKYVRLLEQSGLIATEHRTAFTKTGMKRNSTLRCTIVPMPQVLEERHAQQLAALERLAQRRKAQAKATKLGTHYTPPEGGAAGVRDAEKRTENPILPG